jgi:hypothetical protein
MVGDSMMRYARAFHSPGWFSGFAYVIGTLKVDLQIEPPSVIEYKIWNGQVKARESASQREGIQPWPI